MKPNILYYNNHVIPNIIRDNAQTLEDFYSESFSLELFQTYQKYGLDNNNMIFDRSGVLPHYLNIPLVHTMPSKVDGYNRSFFEISEKRCKELLALGKPINVMWSGGIDSTYILFMLRHFANDPDQVRIYGTYNSILESGDMFERRLSKEFKHIIKVSAGSELNFIEDGIFVSGMCGNQLFGPTDNYFSTSPKAMFHHQFGTPETIYEPYEKNVSEHMLEFLQPIIDASPRKIETVNDLRWYCIFNLDWYTALYEHKVLLGAERANRIHGFFDSYDFQEWAVNTKEPFTKVRGEPNTHRWQMREVLDELFGESYYAKNKDKKISTFSILDSHWLFVFDDMETMFLA